MQKQAVLLVLFIAAATSLHAQDPFSKETIRNFRLAKNDSIFILKNSDSPYTVSVIDLSFPADSILEKLYVALYTAGTGEVSGPYYFDTTVAYIKVVRVDSAYKARVGNIWIDISRGRKAAFEMASKLLVEIKNGKSFDLYCSLYSDDKNKNKDCDLGWIYAPSMLEPFAEAITKHTKDDIYLVETSFGFHIVKSLEDPYLERKSVQYITLTRKRK